MTLQPPKKNGTSYELAITPPVPAPRLQCTSSGWVPTPEWVTWATEERQKRIGELLSHGTWFSRPPRREVIEPLFAPWVGKVGGETRIFCTSPGQAASAVWNLTGLTMTTAAITPIWTLSDVEEQDTISLFGSGSPEPEEEDQLTREIQFDDIASAPESGPTRVRNREWDAAKFMAKERVRESRLKAQIAEHLARKEESRFYAKYGDLEDSESRFSEYDLSDEEESAGTL